MVEATPQDITLEEAIDLSPQVDWFSVTKEAISPAAYAKDVLSKQGISMTGYGALWSLDGQTVEQRLCRTGQGMTMEMK